MEPDGLARLEQLLQALKEIQAERERQSPFSKVKKIASFVLVLITICIFSQFFESPPTYVSLLTPSPRGYGERFFVECVKNGEDEVVQLFLEHGTVSNATRDSRGRTLLMLAITTKSTSMLSLVLPTVGDVSEGDYGRWTPLHYAAAFNFTEAAEILIERGADVARTTLSGLTPLHVAAAAQSPQIAALLLSSGADANVRSEVLPFREAVKWKSPMRIVFEVVVWLSRWPFHLPRFSDDHSKPNSWMKTERGTPLYNWEAAADRTLEWYISNDMFPGHIYPLTLGAASNSTEVVDVLKSGGAELQADDLFCAYDLCFDGLNTEAEQAYAHSESEE
mmetsp:Transcript_21866/g.56791  ORF Transcript_21866/g.56791 Transcript_21866/m.56791 type:complete len:335 (-) Transcript_21866:179-1183(-)